MDRRTRKRDQRRDALLDLAADIVEARGVAGLSMVALAEVADYAPASLYTYFPSRGALVAALQERALQVLTAVAEEQLAAWDQASTDQPARTRAAKRVDALARLWSFGQLFLTAPVHHQREFRLQQELLTTPNVDNEAVAPRVIAAAMAVLDVPRRLIDAAVEVGALGAGRPLANPEGDYVDEAMARTLAWTSAMNGALLVDRLTVDVPVAGLVLGLEVTRALLVGWGAEARVLDDAVALAESWTGR